MTVVKFVFLTCRLKLKVTGVSLATNFVFCRTMVGLKKGGTQRFQRSASSQLQFSSFFCMLFTFSLCFRLGKLEILCMSRRIEPSRPRPLSFFCHSSLTLKKALVRALVRITCAQRKFSLTCFIDASCLLIWFSSIIGLPGQVSPGSSLWVKEEKMVPL